MPSRAVRSCPRLLSRALNIPAPFSAQCRASALRCATAAGTGSAPVHRLRKGHPPRPRAHAWLGRSHGGRTLVKIMFPLPRAPLRKFIRLPLRTIADTRVYDSYRPNPLFFPVFRTVPSPKGMRRCVLLITTGTLAARLAPALQYASALLLWWRGRACAHAPPGRVRPRSALAVALCSRSRGAWSRAVHVWQAWGGLNKC